MSKVDELVERGAGRLEGISHQAARSEGLLSKLAEPLADEAAFLRKLKPSLIRTRIHGEDPGDAGASVTRPVRTRQTNQGKAATAAGGPNPFAVAVVALAIGVALAKLVDWRSHAHPRG